MRATARRRCRRLRRWRDRVARCREKAEGPEQAPGPPQGRSYLPTTIRTPAAMARIAITVPKPERLSSGIKPFTMSQTANSSMPMFFVILICRSPFGFDFYVLPLRPHSLEPNPVGQDLPPHTPVAEKAEPGIAEGSGSVVLEEKMPRPGERVALHQSDCNQPPVLCDDGADEQHQGRGCANEMQAAAGSIRMFAQVERIELTVRAVAP